MQEIKYSAQAVGKAVENAFNEVLDPGGDGSRYTVTVLTTESRELLSLLFNEKVSELGDEYEANVFVTGALQRWITSVPLSEFAADNRDEQSRRERFEHTIQHRITRGEPIPAETTKVLSSEIVRNLRPLAMRATHEHSLTTRIHTLRTFHRSNSRAPYNSLLFKDAHKSRDTLSELIGEMRLVSDAIEQSSDNQEKPLTACAIEFLCDTVDHVYDLMSGANSRRRRKRFEASSTGKELCALLRSCIHWGGDRPEDIKKALDLFARLEKLSDPRTKKPGTSHKCIAARLEGAEYKTLHSKLTQWREPYDRDPIPADSPRTAGCSG